jgi:hypothetical protein
MAGRLAVADIRGEGIISLTKVFERTLSGLSIRDFSTYAQVFMGG